MHALHEYLCKQLGEQLKQRRVVVWYDTPGEYQHFITELLDGTPVPAETATSEVTVQGQAVQFAQFAGSYFATRAAVEPLVAGDMPGPVLIYMPGAVWDRKGSLLTELEMAGHVYQRELRTVARQAFLQQHFTDGLIDDLLAPESLSYADIAMLIKRSKGDEPPSHLMTAMPITHNETLIATWLADPSWDEVIQKKQATGELVKLIRSCLGFDPQAEDSLVKLRTTTLRYVLVGEFRSDLTCPVPPVLDSVAAPETKDQGTALREVAARLRKDFAEVYPALADQVEAEMSLACVAIPADALGTLDTFRFEEKALLDLAGTWITETKYQSALQLVTLREHSFWLDRNVARKAQWQACRLMAELGTAIAATYEAIDKLGDNPKAWVDWYVGHEAGGTPGMKLDQVHRRLETWLATLDDEPEAETALALVRGAYDDACNRMAKGFSRALQKAEWQVPGVLSQKRVFQEMVHDRPRPLAYLFVDAMRYEMGVELAERLSQATDLSVRPAVASLPTITPIGMAALLPGASASFDVVEQGGKLGSRIDGAFLPDLTARKKFMASRAPGLADFTLDDLLALPASKLAKKLEGATLIVVRSQEIDKAGEDGFSILARQIMDTVIDNVARAIRKLSAAGIEHFVVSSDHGHHFTTDKDESMRIDAPGGGEVDLHRRCWIGRGGATPPGCVRITGAALGYDTDLDFVFPLGSGVFKAGGDLGFHHGGLSLQELLVPVVTLRMPSPAGEKPNKSAVLCSGMPEVITNRIFSIVLAANATLFSTGSVTVRPVLLADGQQVGGPGMVIDGELDRTTGCVTVTAEHPATVAMMLSRDDVQSVRVVIQDPTTDAILYQSKDIPMKLGT